MSASVATTLSPSTPTPATAAQDTVLSQPSAATAGSHPATEEENPGTTASRSPDLYDVETGAARAARGGGDGDGGDGSESDFPELAPQRFWLLSIGICLGLFLAMLDSSIVATSLLTIGDDLGSFNQLNWVALAYTLSYLGCAVIFARIADVIGRRNAYLAAFVIFFSFSLGCGFAQSLNQLIACRALQGVGGSGLYSLSMTIWPEVAPVRMQQHISSLAGVVVGAAGVLGPVLGGVLTHYASWRWVFWISCPVGLVSMVVFTLTWPKPEQLPPFAARPWTSLDFAGSLLLIAAAVLVTFSFQNAGSDTAQWDKAIFLAPLLVGTACWAALVAWERSLDRHAPHTMAAFPMALFRNRVYAATFVHTMLIGFPFFVVIYALPLRLQAVNGKSALLAGLMLLPMLAGVSLGSFISGTVNTRANRLCETFVAGSAVTVLGCGLETTLSDGAALEPKSLGFLVFIGMGCGLAAASATIMASFEAPAGEHAPAQGIIAQIRVLGGSIGIAASTAILAAQEVAKLGHVVTTSAAALTSSSTSPAERALVREIFADAFTEDMRVSTIVAAVSLVVAFATYRRDRSRPMHIRHHTEDDDDRAEMCAKDSSKASSKEAHEAPNGPPSRTPKQAEKPKQAEQAETRTETQAEQEKELAP